MVFQPHPSELWNCRHFWYGNWTANLVIYFSPARFYPTIQWSRWKDEIFSKHWHFFDLRWNARGNIGRVLFLITEYLYKLYLDVNDGCRVLVSSCTWKVSDFRKSRCDDEFFVKGRHPTKPNHQEKKKPSNPDNFIHKPSTASLWH